jgi:hypothetical protein
MSYGIKINLPDGLAIDDNSVPFALAEVITLTDTSPNGSKTYTGYEGLRLQFYQISTNTNMFNGGYLRNGPLPHVITVTNNATPGIAPTISWSVSLPNSNFYLISSKIFVVMK